MAHIELPEGAPGIWGPLQKYPETAEPLFPFVQALMRGPSSLTAGERELIAAYVSSLNECSFCTLSHSATARCLLGEEHGMVDQVLQGLDHVSIGPKLKALLVIAGKVQKGGRNVTASDVAKARAEGADDKAIHDTVLVTSAFCMFNRYVDGLDTWAPEDPAFYEERAKRSAGQGGTTSRSEVKSGE